MADTKIPGTVALGSKKGQPPWLAPMVLELSSCPTRVVGNLFELRYVCICMRVLCLCGVFLIVIVVSACGGDEPASVSEPATQSQRASAPLARQETQGHPAAQAPTPSEVGDHASDSRTTAAGEDEREEAPPAEVSGEAEAESESEQQSSDAVVEDSVDVEAEKQELESAEPPQDLTELPGTVVEDADVRVRPGLAWGVIDRLESGASVVVLHRAGGWYRVRYGAELMGWVRATMLDLGGVEEWQVLEEAAPPLIAEWRGEEYGVMGQSADGTEVRLLEVSGESTRIIGAPIDEVTLLADDVTLRDLPILIGDETVVFPGDDFGVGQGKILPKANEWMWLPWGWLLAHNDTHIWQWRPETDELEFVARPPGFAKLSPDGRYLAIANLCTWGWISLCEPIQHVTVLPLDGSPPTSLFEQLRRRGASTRVTWYYWVPEGAMEWSPDSSTVVLYVGTEEEDAPDDEAPDSISLVFHVDGQITRFEEWAEFQIEGLTCRVFRLIDDWTHHWAISEDNVISAELQCGNTDGDTLFLEARYTLSGRFLNFVDFDPRDWDRGSKGIDLLRSAAGGAALGDELIIDWSPSEELALVFDLTGATAWTYDAGRHELEAVEFELNDPPQSRLRHAIELGDDLRAFWMLSTWHGKQVGAAIQHVWSIRAYLLIDTATGVGTVLDLGGPASYPYWPGSQSWNPTGTEHHIATRPSEPTDGLAVGAPGTHQLLSFDQSGGLVGALKIAGLCEGSVPAQFLRHQADWSPKGEWFAIGGIELSGLAACTRRE